LSVTTLIQYDKQTDYELLKLLKSTFIEYHFNHIRPHCIWELARRRRNSSSPSGKVWREQRENFASMFYSITAAEIGMSKAKILALFWRLFSKSTRLDLPTEFFDFLYYF